MRGMSETTIHTYIHTYSAMQESHIITKEEFVICQFVHVQHWLPLVVVLHGARRAYSRSSSSNDYGGGDDDSCSSSCSSNDDGDSYSSSVVMIGNITR